MTLSIVRANYLNDQHRAAIANLLNDYASDPMGGGTPLDTYVVSSVAEELAKLPYAASFLCFVGGSADGSGDESAGGIADSCTDNCTDSIPVGLINCFEGFSTFKAKKLINIHDIYVAAEYRGQGISRMLVSAVETLAISRDCCKLTLEVLEGNSLAKQAYANMGFNSYELDAATGRALFWEKPLL